MSSLFPRLVIAFIAALVIGSWFSVPHWVAALSCIIILIISLLFSRHRGPCPYTLLLLLFVSLGVLYSQGIIPQHLPPDHVIYQVTADGVDLEGVVVRSPEIREDRTRLVLRALRIYSRQHYNATQGLVLITVGHNGDRFHYGDRLRFRCPLRTPLPQGNPGGLNWQRYLALREILLQGFVADGREILLIRHHQAGWWKGQVEKARRRLSTFFRETFPTPAREFLLALVVGERWAVPDVWREHFAALGISHLLAISGLHLGLIAFIAYGLAKWLLLRSSSLALRIPVEKWSWGLVLPVLLGYAWIAGMSTSTQRALIMILTLALCFVLDRVRNLLHALALAALIILLIRPASIYDIAFQLSFLAVLGILYALPRWKEALFRTDPLLALKTGGQARRMSKAVIILGLTSSAALLSTLPVSLLHFHRLPTAALPANLILVPIVGFFILPLALAGSAIFLLWPLAGKGLLWICAWLLQCVAQGVQWGANLMGRGLYLPAPHPWEVALFYGFCVGLCNLHKAKWVRWSTFAVASVLLGLWLGEWGFRHLERELRVHCLSVDNGLAILVEGPKANRMLVDGGGTFHDQVDMGALQVAPLLWHRRVVALDRVILSHPHPDHMNGLRYVFERFRVGQLLDNGDHPDTAAYRSFHDLAQRCSAPPMSLYRGMTWKMGEALVQVLYPPRDGRKQPGKNGAARTNNGSLVLKISLGNASFLLPGDIEAETEDWLVSLGGLHSTVLIAPHHGSRTSSTGPFLDAVSPRFAVFSSRQGRWGLVHEEILKRYQSRGVQTFHTGRDGMVTFGTEGRILEIKTHLGQISRQIKLGED
jgi:competence protein ComEC